MRHVSYRISWAPLCLCLAAGLLGAAPAAAGEATGRLNLDIRPFQITSGPASTSPGVLALSLRDSIALALKGNLDIAVETFTPQIREQDLTGEKAVYDPSAFLELTRSDSRLPATLSLLTGSRVLTDLWDFNTGLKQKLPTGGTYELRFNNEYLHVPSSAAGEGFVSKLGLTLSQPLLRNFGLEVNETGIRIATNNQAISREQLRLKVSDIVTQAQNAYMELIFATENLEVQRRSLRLAQELVSLNTARVRAGVAGAGRGDPGRGAGGRPGPGRHPGREGGAGRRGYPQSDPESARQRLGAGDPARLRSGLRSEARQHGGGYPEGDGVSVRIQGVPSWTSRTRICRFALHETSSCPIWR